MKYALYAIAMIMMSFTATAQANEAAMTPDQVVATYLIEMGKGNMAANLPIYTRNTQNMLYSRPASKPVVGQALFKTYLGCVVNRTEILNGFAVVRYRLRDRKCAPFLLLKEDDVWKLDLTLMSRTIRFNQSDEWYFITVSGNPYMFGFPDWKFDQNGVPVLPSALKK